MGSSEKDGDDHRLETVRLAERLFSDRRLIIASNRGPAEYELDGGKLRARRGSGGVVTALTSLSSYTGLTWVASPMGDVDRQLAQSVGDGRLPSPFAKQDLSLRFVLLPSGAYERHYKVFCNPLLWFTQHYLWDLVEGFDLDSKYLDSWTSGYLSVNRAFVETILAEAARTGGERPVIMLHDYHLYLAGKSIRARLPNAILQHFIHIPWPDPAYWMLLPRVVRTSICESLCGNDIVGLQTRRDAFNFLHSCHRFVDGAAVDYHRGTVTVAGRTTAVRTYPISVDVEGLKRMLGSPEVGRYRQRLIPLMGDKTIVRVDRLDPSKNIARGFKAFAALLSARPDLRGRVKFWAFLVPSRTDIPEYRRYSRKVKSLIRSINESFGTETWRPIEMFYENNYTQAIAAMTLYDVLMVNPLIDGMNLVAKEGPLVNQRDGVLVLSEGAGAFEQLKHGVVPVSPTDIEGMAEALGSALDMPPAARQAKISYLRRTIEGEDLSHWLYRQLKDIEPLVEAQWMPAIAEKRTTGRSTEVSG